MQLHEKKSAVDIDVIVEADRWAREKGKGIYTKEFISNATLTVIPACLDPSTCSES